MSTASRRDLQYDLRRRAAELGWPADRVLVIDEDQGRSGRTVAGRPGFQRLLAEVTLDHVGMILGMEMSRLARSCGLASAARAVRPLRHAAGRPGRALRPDRPQRPAPAGALRGS